MNTKNEYVLGRQGDVLIKKVESIPAAAKQQDPEKGRFKIEDGEATGHAHAVKEEEGISMFIDGGVKYLQVGIATALTHEEHSPITLEPGIYEFRRQREYSPESIRYVLD